MGRTPLPFLRLTHQGSLTGGVVLNPFDPRTRTVECDRMLESEKHNGRMRALKRREDTGVVPWQLYMSVIGVLVAILGGTLAIVLGAIWYFDQGNGPLVVNIEL